MPFKGLSNNTTYVSCIASNYEAINYLLLAPVTSNMIRGHKVTGTLRTWDIEGSYSSKEKDAEEQGYAILLCQSCHHVWCQLPQMSSIWKGHCDINNDA